MLVGGIYQIRQKKKKRCQDYYQLLQGVAHPHQYRCEPLVIVLDIGSSSVRASCFALFTSKDQNTKTKNTFSEWLLISGSLKQIYMDCMDHEGTANILHIRAAVEKVLDQTISFLRSKHLTGNILGVGISTFGMNLLGVDEMVRIFLKLKTSGSY